MKSWLMDLASDTTRLSVGTGNNQVNIPTASLSDASVAGILNAVYLWAGIIAVIVIVIAGFFYVTSAGDANRISRAKNAIIGSVVGLIIVLMAFTITQFVLGNVG